MRNSWPAPILALLLQAAAPPQQPFWIAQIPDTQHYTVDPTVRMLHFHGITWHLARWRPAFVTHVGDLTENATDVEFLRAMDAMRHLDQAGVPYRICAGNHDYEGGRKPDLTRFRQWVGAPTGFFRHDRFLAINLEWLPSDAEIAWARELMDENPNLPVFLTTHEWIGGGNPGQRSLYGGNRDGDGDNSAEDVYQKLVVPYPQVSLVMCGHKHGEGVRTDVTPLGRTVHQVLFNSQDDPYGGQGFMRLIAFHNFGIDVWTLSMSFQGLSPNRGGYYRLSNNLHNPPPRTIHVREGSDTYLIPVWPQSVRTHADNVVGADGGAFEMGLLKFDLPPGLASCRKALLTVTVEGYSADGDGLQFHRMRRAWSDTDSWSSLGGITIGVGTEPVADAVTGRLAKGTVSIDVTASVQAWVAGQPNHGWCIQGLGESTGFRSLDWRAPAERPLLTIVP